MQSTKASAARVKDEEKEEETMRAVTVYRLDSGGDNRYRTRHPIGSVLELRKHERGNNYADLLRLARRLFVFDTADTVRLVIGASQTRGAIFPEVTRDCSAG
jgi:hypothetical protein